MTSTKTKVKTKVKTEIEVPLDNGELEFEQIDRNEDPEEQPTYLGRHIELPESPDYLASIGRKQGTKSENVILTLQLPGFKDTKDFMVRITTPGYDRSIPELINFTIKKLDNFKIAYKKAQTAALVTVDLKKFFLM